MRHRWAARIAIAAWFGGCGPAPPPVTPPPLVVVVPRAAPHASAPISADADAERDLRLAPAARAHEGIAAAPASELTPPVQPRTPPSRLGHCLRSRYCQLEGLCSVDDEGRCVAASNADCHPSDACLGGRCTAEAGHCVAGSDRDCRGSWACRAWGRCFHDSQHACEARLAADCKLSTRCQRLGQCTLLSGACVATTGPSP